MIRKGGGVWWRKVEVDISESGEEGKRGRGWDGRRGKWWRRVCRKKNGAREERGSEDNQITEVEEMEEEVEK